MAEVLHASAVAVGGRAALILGPSGSGKSALALDLLSLGAVLVADDRVELVPGPDGRPLADAPAALRGRIEARGVGLIRTAWAGRVPVALAVDLARPPGARLPPPRTITCLGTPVPLFWTKGVPNLAAILFIALNGEVEVHD